MANISFGTAALAICICSYSAEDKKKTEKTRGSWHCFIDWGQRQLPSLFVYIRLCCFWRIFNKTLYVSILQQFRSLRIQVPAFQAFCLPAIFRQFNAKKKYMQKKNIRAIFHSH